MLISSSASYAEGPQVTMDFPDVEIKDMVKSISEITGKNFVIESSVSGKVSIMSPTPVTVDEAYAAFESALSMKGYAVCQEGKVNKIMKKSAAKRECGIPVEEEYSVANGDEMITRIIPIQFIDANEIQKALKLMISQTTGSSVAYGPTNSLIVTDSASNIRRLIRIIQKLDKQGFEKSVEVIPLKYAQATDVAEKILTIYNQKKGGGGDNSFSYNIERGAEVAAVIPDPRTNSLIITANRKGLSNVLDLIAELDKEVANEMNQGKIHVRHLKHADAEQIAELLSSLLGGGSGSKKSSSAAKKTPPKVGVASNPVSSPVTPLGDGEAGNPSLVAGGGDAGIFQDDIRVVADPGTNSLVITATPSDYNSLETVLRQLDVRRPQVFVEALIMEVGMTKELNVGVSGHGGAANSNGIAFGAVNTGTSTLAPNLANAATMQGLVLGGLGKALTLGGLSIPAQGLIFNAMQQNMDVNVLSAPNILTSDNQKAEIIVGETTSVPTQATTDITSGNTVNSFQRESVALELHVTPQINDGDEVTLQIEQKIEDIKNKNQEDIRKNGLETSKREARTTVISQNGQTVVIGGLIKDKESKTKTKVPVLGDIPIVGNLFKQTNIGNEKVNLMVFITPTILRDPKDMSRMSVQKNSQRQRFNKSNNITENKGLYKYGYDETMNMSAPAAATDVAQPDSSSGAKKRFNYEQEELKSASSGDEEEAPVRNRVDEDDVRTSDRTTVRPRQASSTSNPFADVKPQ